MINSWVKESKINWPFSYGASVRENVKAQRAFAIDEAVKRCIACPGLSLRESAEVILRNIHLMPELMLPQIRAEFAKIMDGQ